MLVGFAMLAVMLFVPAGTWQFYQAWVMLGVLFVPMANLVFNYASLHTNY